MQMCESVRDRESRRGKCTGQGEKKKKERRKERKGDLLGYL